VSIDFYTKLSDRTYFTFFEDTVIQTSGFNTAQFTTKMEVIEYFNNLKLELVKFRGGIEDKKFLQ
jgi:hypothetical protein